MRTCNLLLFCLGLSACLSSCDFRSSSSPATSFRRATGWPFEVVVVMDRAVWKGEAGQLLKEQLEESVPAIPQVEPSMRLTYSEPDRFNGLLMFVRNVLIVKVDSSMYTRSGFKDEKDKWASGQNVVYLYAPSAAALTEYLLLNEGKLVTHFNTIERNRWMASYDKSHSSKAKERLEKQMGISVLIPEDMVACKEESDFLWFSNNANRGRMDFLAYSFPYTTEQAFTSDYLVAMRDSALMRNVPGSFPNSYMTTEKRYGLTYEPISFRGEYCGVLRGLWRVEGDKMGGPFVCHALLDKKRQRVIMVEAFVFAPESKKANLIRRLEASLFTFRFTE